MAIELIKVSEFEESPDLKSWLVVADAGGISYKISVDNVKSQLGISSLMQYGGAVEPTDSPQPTGDYFWQAAEAGTYTNFNGIVVPVNSLALISRVGGVWSSSITTITPQDLSGYVQKTQIINDLTTGGATEVLSAEQGVVLNDKIEEIAGTEYDLTKVAESQLESSSSFVYQSSTFSGWGGKVGIFNNFQAISVKLKPFDAGNIPTQVRARIMTGVANGTILADKTVDVSMQLDVEQKVYFIFDNIVANPTNADLWVEYKTDGYVGIFRQPTGSTRNVLYSTSKSLTAVFNGPSTTPNDRMFVEFYTAAPKLEFTDDAKDSISRFLDAEYSIEKNSASIILPSRIYALEGIETNIYFDNMIRSNIASSLLDIDISCSKGRHDSRRWTYTPVLADAGTVDLTVTVNDANGIVLATKIVSLVTIAKTSGTGVTRKVNMWGDSNLADGQPLAIINTQLASDPMNLTFVGTLGTGNAKHEGRSGWGIYNYTISTGGNPLWNAGVSNIDYAYYLSQAAITMAAGDWMIIQLGTNDMFNIFDDAALATLVTVAVANFNKVINTARASVSGIRIGVCTSLPPSISQDAFGDNYNNGQRMKRFLKNIQALQSALIDAYDNDASRTNNIHLIPTHSAIDRTFGFPYSDVNANSRSTAQIRYWSNGVHPQQSGYDQLGDSLFQFLKAFA